MKLFIFLLVSIIVLLILLFFLFFDQFRNKYERKYFKKRVHKKLYYLSEEEDYLLLNNVKIELGIDNQPSVFDHILFADKYIYLINDVYLEGAIAGNSNDTYIILRNGKSKQKKMNNFLKAQNMKVELFCHKFQIDREVDNYVFNVVCYNSSLIVTKSLRIKEYGEWFLPLKELIKTIRISEKDDIKTISKARVKDLFNSLKKSSDKLKAHQAPKYN